MNRRPDAWIKSSYSASGSSCVELLLTASTVSVRDSKNPTGPVLGFAATTWRRFLTAPERLPKA